MRSAKIVMGLALMAVSGIVSLAYGQAGTGINAQDYLNPDGTVNPAKIEAAIKGGKNPVELAGQLVTAAPTQAADITAAVVTAAPTQAADITAAAVTAAPTQAADITAHAVTAAPTQAADITAAAVGAAPTQAADITAAAVGAAPTQSADITAHAVSAAPSQAAGITAAAIAVVQATPPPQGVLVEDIIKAINAAVAAVLQEIGLTVLQGDIQGVSKE